MKFIDNSGYIIDRAEPKYLVEVRDDEPGRNAAPRPALHLWLPGSHPSHRVADASAGAPGEMRPGYPIPNGPDAPIERDQFPGPGTSGGLPEATRTQSAEPERAGFDQYQPPAGTQLNPDEEAEMRNRNGEPTYVDARSLRISGRDQTGKMWGATLWLPQEQPDHTLAQMGDRALTDLVNGPGDGHIAGLAALQRQLNNHYRRGTP
jgi:hypothetical protein